MRLRRGSLELPRRPQLARPGHLAPGGALTPILQPGPRRWVRALAVLLVPLLLVAALVGWLWPRDVPLAQLRLDGPRAPACLRLVVMPDMSGSMVEFTAARDAAFGQVVRWSAANLRDDDELVVVPWAGSAAVALGPTPVRQMTTSRLPAAPIDLSGTDLVAALHTVVELPASECHEALVLLTDTVVGTLPAGLPDELVGPTVTSLTAVLPDGADLTQDWVDALPFTRTIRADARDGEATAHSLGEVVAFATGQRLVRVDG